MYNHHTVLSHIQFGIFNNTDKYYVQMENTYNNTYTDETRQMPVKAAVKCLL